MASPFEPVQAKPKFSPDIIKLFAEQIQLFKLDHKISVRIHLFVIIRATDREFEYALRQVQPCSVKCHPHSPDNTPHVETRRRRHH